MRQNIRKRDFRNRVIARGIARRFGRGQASVLDVLLINRDLTMTSFRSMYHGTVYHGTETIDVWRGVSDHARKIEARYRALGLHHLAAAGKWCKDLLRNRS